MTKNTQNQTFYRWAQLVVRWRMLVLAITVVIFGVAAYFAKNHTRVDTSVEAFAHSGSETQQVLEAYRETFGQDSTFLVLVRGPVFSLPYLNALKAFHDDLSQLNLDVEVVEEKRPGTPIAADESTLAVQAEDFDDFGEDSGDAWGDEDSTIVDEIISLINVRQTRRGPDGGLIVGQLMEPFPSAEALPDLKKSVLADERLVGQVVDKRGAYSAITLRTQKLTDVDAIRVYDAIMTICEKHVRDDFAIQVGGLPALNGELNRLMMMDLQSIFLWSLVVMFCVLLYLFRHPLGVLPPLFVVVAAGVMTIGTVAALGLQLTMLSNILPAFLFCVGIGHSVHLISVYRDSLAEGLPPHDAIAHALATTGVPILYTSLTTMVGLLSFHFASLEAIQEMGYAGAFAVLLAFLLSITFLPAALSFNRKGKFGRVPITKRDNLDRFLDFCLWTSADKISAAQAKQSVWSSRRRLNLLTMCGLIIAGVTASFQLNVWHNPMDWIPESVPIKRAFDAIDTHLGGTATVQILVESDQPNGVKRTDVLNGMIKLQDHIKSYTDPQVGSIIGNSISVADIVRETNRVMTTNTEADYRIPDTDRGVSDMLFLFENSGREQLERLVTTNYTHTHMTVRMKWLEATSYLGLTDHIRTGVEAYIPSSVRARPTGSVYTLVSTIGQMIRDLLASFGVAFVVITVIMMVLLGGVRLGMIAMVPNLMPIIMIMGMMGIAGIPINMSTLLIASIAIGLAVDDTIHLLHHFRVHYDATGDREAALRNAVGHSGRAMVSTTLILMLGFFTYLAADMTNIVQFGFLVGTTALFALLIDLFFAPALIRVFYPRQSPLGDASRV